MSWNTFIARARRSFDARPFRITIITLLGLLVALAIFEGGVLFGLHQARSSYSWGEAYQRNFGGPAGGFIPRPGSNPNGHGVFGQIASTSADSFIITDPSHPEQTVRVASTTIIRSGGQDVSASTLTAGAYVVVIGTPTTDGVIDATLIRVMPAPQGGTATVTSK